MSSTVPIETAGNRLAVLLEFLEADPDNPALLGDAAEAAIAARDPATASALLQRHAAIRPLPPRQANLAGVAAMQAGDFEAAREHFGPLVDAGDAAPAVRFNLAWTLAMLKHFAAAAELLDEKVTAGLPQAAMLHVQLLHEQGLFDEAAAAARALIQIHPGHAGLMAAVSVLALDIDDEALARTCAGRAGAHPDALSTLGMLELGDDRAGEARNLFDRALALDDAKPRAWVGRGLSKLLTGETAGASQDLDRGAELFGDHLGSWLAAGWAYFVDEDLKASRARFETALELDPTFAETHGSLAVLDLLEGETESAKKRRDTALRLDPRCYTGALAKALMAAQAGDQHRARRTFEQALKMPIGANGRTIIQSLHMLGVNS